MKRNIIIINEEKCTGCGACVPDCPEGALQVINGKARLVGDLLCDGLGACIGRCPEGALTVEEHEVAAYNEYEVMKNVARNGAEVIQAHLKHLYEHRQNDYLEQAKLFLKEKGIPVPDYKTAEKEKPLACGCPGTMAKDFRGAKKEVAETHGKHDVPSALEQWPIQLALLNPHAPYFENADVVIAADCVPFAYANFHTRFLRNKRLIMFCPKLDPDLDAYSEKLAAIIRDNTIRSITIVHMEVPCCAGTTRLVETALTAAGKNLIVKEYTISLQGEIV